MPALMKSGTLAPLEEISEVQSSTEETAAQTDSAMTMVI